MMLKAHYFQKSGIEIAEALVGSFLCIRRGGQVEKYLITETELYSGESDTACHAHKGRTKRTEVMYQSGGLLYIYLCYGIHHLLNIVTGREGYPEAVLIRGIEGFNGPGRLTKALGITKAFNGCSLDSMDYLWIEERKMNVSVAKGPRIGIGYASLEDQNRPWRFFREENR